MLKNKLIIYGAVAKIPTSSKRWEKSKNFFHQILDRIKIKTKKITKLIIEITSLAPPTTEEIMQSFKLPIKLSSKKLRISK